MIEKSNKLASLAAKSLQGTEKNVKFAILNGHNWGAIWSYRGLSTTTQTARASSWSEEGSQSGINRFRK